MHHVKGKTIYFITGASATGKTTLVKKLKAKYNHKPWAFLHFDEIGVPSRSEMEKEFGSGAAWQKAKTFEWIDKLIHLYQIEKIFFEGQVNPDFIRSAFQSQNFGTYKVIVLDCREEEMGRRLLHERKQPELFNADMRNWLAFLRQQASRMNDILIDTSDLTEDELLTSFESAIKV